MTLLKKIVSLPVLFGVVFVAVISAQDSQPSPQKSVNFGYSRNPKTKSKPAILENTAKKLPIPAPEIKTFSSETLNNPVNLISENEIGKPVEFESYSSAAKTLEIAKRANTAAPTEIYKIGVGDVLFISLQNAPSKASTYFTVLGDGSIDYPLARGMVPVAGSTVEEVEDLLKEKVKLYENPQISVKVREHASHSITVLGLVEKSGEQFLEREAIPLYVVKAKSIVQPNANRLFIKRAGGAAENINLKDANAEEILIFPGDILEFKSSEAVSENTDSRHFYYIGGEINSAGQKDFHSGISLTQAILASGGLRKPNVKKVVIRRKNEQGLLSPIEFDLIAIKDGKQPDPILRAGDTVEILK
ncbi:MAG TPA: polysaccharide biosynthesis/export family protein [Pyrinomonadaceae bacterium]|nr:polysaccharide biosynthesis/export family protein [Pyrinomonadaceae bacterium]